MGGSFGINVPENKQGLLGELVKFMLLKKLEMLLNQWRGDLTNP